MWNPFKKEDEYETFGKDIREIGHQTATNDGTPITIVDVIWDSHTLPSQRTHFFEKYKVKDDLTGEEFYTNYNQSDKGIAE